MAKKELKCVYHQVTSSSEILLKLQNFLKSPTQNSNTEDIKKYKFYILDDCKQEEDYVCFTIAKVDTEETPNLDDIETQERRPIEKGENEGLAKDAQFLYHFESNILAQRKGKSIANMKELQEFLAKKMNVSSNEIDFQLILEKDVVEKFSKMDLVEKFKFSVAIPNQLSLFASDDNDVQANVNLAKELDAENLFIEFKGQNLNKSKISEVVDILKRKNEKVTIDVKSLSVYGENEILDLIKGSLQYFETIEYAGLEITNEEIYTFLTRAYIEKEDYLGSYQNDEKN